MKLNINFAAMYLARHCNTVPLSPGSKC